MVPMTTGHVSRADVGLRSARGPVLLAVMLCTALVAIDATIIATAVPAIVSDLGGFSQFPWLFSVYLLAQAVSVPVYGKVADLFGRRPVMLFGIGMFLVGSVLCGAAWTMPVLIAARVVQGLGAGAVLPMSMTILGDLYSVAERAKVQGYVASVWGVASVVGPTLGGVFSEYASWRWIFFVNLPVGALAAAMLLRGLHEQVVRREHRIDYAGAALLVSGCSLLVLALLEGGVAWDWTSAVGVSVVATGLALLAVFVAVERRAAEPVLPQWVFTRRVLVGTNAVSFGVGALLIGLTSYVPTFAQGVLGSGPLVAGFALAAMTIGWPISASQAGRLYVRIGFRDTALIGSAAVVSGSCLLLLLDTGSTVWQVAGVLLRDRPGLRAGGEPHAGGRPVGRRLGPSRGGHRHQHVRPLDGERDRRGGVRRDRQHDAHPLGSRRPPRVCKATCRRRPTTLPWCWTTRPGVGRTPVARWRSSSARRSPMPRTRCSSVCWSAPSSPSAPCCWCRVAPRT